MPDVTPPTLLEIVATYWPIPLISFTVSLLATPICRKVALACNFVDRPDAWLKTHATPIPYGGGVAIYAGWMCGVLMAVVGFANANAPTSAPGGSPSMYTNVMVIVLVSGTLITLLGFVDDLRSISPRVKLLVSIAIAALVVTSGIGDEIVRVLSGSARVRFLDDELWLVWAYSLPVSMFVIVGACNATNLIDGLDGLCSGVLAIISIGFLILAVHMHMHSNWGPRDVQRVVLSLALLGAAVGFLPYNRNPARIFMGDAGSMLLGLNAAILLLMFADEQRVKWMLGSTMVFGLPVADMILTLTRRWRAQRPLMAGDRSHFYDQLIDRGYSVKTVVRISYALTAAFVVLGDLVIGLRTRHIILIYIVAAAALAFAIHHFKMVRVDSPSTGERPSSPPDAAATNVTATAGPASDPDKSGVST